MWLCKGLIQTGYFWFIWRGLSHHIKVQVILKFTANNVVISMYAYQSCDIIYVWYFILGWYEAGKYSCLYPYENAIKKISMRKLVQACLEIAHDCIMVAHLITIIAHACIMCATKNASLRTHLKIACTASIKIAIWCSWLCKLAHAHDHPPSCNHKLAFQICNQMQAHM